MSGEKRRHLFLIVKEILHNVVKHSKASRVNLEVEVGAEFEILIKDNGIGFEEKNDQSGNGIKNLKKRINTLGGKIFITSQDGVEFSISIPLVNL